MLEGYITPLLMSYISKYVKNIKPSDLKLSFWGGDAVLRNLELRLDVLEQELQWPVEFKSGRIRELTLHIPWSSILSTPVEVSIKDIEFVVKLKDVRLHSSLNSSHSDASQAPRENPAAAEATSSSTQSPGEQAAAGGGGGQGYLSRISNNVIFHIQNLVVKVIEEECDMMLTLNIPTVELFTADENWKRVFVYTDYFQGDYALYGVWEIKDMIINLHQIDNSGQVQDSREPLVQRCSFSWHTKSTYCNGVYVHKATNVLFERIEFSCDENQFCLYLHLLDWILAKYYSSKRLRGRDDKPKSADDRKEADEPPRGLNVGMDGDSLQSFVIVPDEQSADSKSPASSAAVPGSPPQAQGWGTWAWSFMGAAQAQSNVQSQSGTVSDGATSASAITPSSSFSIFAKSVSIDMKVTHQIQIPVFYSTKSFTRSVLKINFTGIVFQLDQDPVTQLFLVSMGAMSVSAAITGLCSCVQKLPSSWRAITDHIPIFSLGMEESLCDPSIILRESLFDPKTDTEPGEQHPATLPPNPLRLLESRAEVFTAAWLTYEYYDIGPIRKMEECTEILQLGRAEVIVSLDVVHRLQHFYRAYSRSLEANPLFSEGMVVIGDPKAETIAKIRMAGGRVMLTPNTHYIPACDTRQQSLKTSNKTPQKASSLKLPIVCFAITRSSIHITQPMYNGNASEEVPQKYHLRAEIRDVTGGGLDSQGIHFQEEDFTDLEQFLHIPNLEISQHSKNVGIEERQTSYSQLDVEEGSATLSLPCLSKLLSIIGSWRGESVARSLLAGHPPPLSKISEESELGQLHFLVKNLTVTQSISEQFSLLSAVLGECSGSLVKSTRSDKLEPVLPFFHGPLDTQEWNTIRAYEELKSKPGSVDCSEERLVELFIATPHQELKDERFPAFQLSVAGLALCLDPSLLAFVRLVSLKDYQAPFGYEVPLEDASSPKTARRDLHPGSLPLGSTTASLPRPTTPSTDVPADDATPPPETKEDLLATLKQLAAKIKINPVLLILPNETCDGVDATEDIISPIPILPALAASLADTHSSQEGSHTHSPAAVILCLPQVKLESAKSHVLDEPVPRNSRPDTLPWNCTLSQFTLFTIAGHRAHSLLEPATVQASLAAQQEGTGITVHVDTLALSFSQKQAALLSNAISRLADSLTPLYSSTPTHEDAEDSGIVSNSTQTVPNYAPSLLSSPAHSTVTLTTLPTVTESTASSLMLYPGFSSLWVQVIVSKLSVSLFLTEPKSSETTKDAPTSSSTYTTPLTSPLGRYTEDSPDVGGVENTTCSLKTKLQVEADSISLQLDSQEKSTEVILKVTSLDCTYFKKEEERWVSFLASEKLFSSCSSTLPAKLSQAIAQSVCHTVPHVHLNLMQTAPSPKLHRSFILIEAKFPSVQLHKPPKIRVSVHSFEVVVWLPVLTAAQRLLSAVAGSLGAQSKSPADPEPSTTAGWPAVEVSMESFRLILPSIDYTSTILLSLGALCITSTLDYPGPDIRFIVNSSAFRKLSLLSSEKKQPPLPAYQLDAFSLSLWGLRSGGPLQSPSVLLYVSSADVRLLYSPALRWTPATVAHTHNTGGRRAPVSGVIACGHCVEANISTDVNLMLGPEQVACISDVLATNTSLQIETKESMRDSRAALPAEAANTISVKTPFKFLLTGRTLTTTLLSDDPASTYDGLFESGISQSDFSYGGAAVKSAASVTPVLQVVLFNPLCSWQSENGNTKCEVSVFNMAVSCSDEPTPVAYPELLDLQVGGVSSLGIPLLETRRGQAEGKDGAPSSILTLNWSSSHSENISVLSVDVERPIRLTLSHSLLRDLLQLLTDMSDAYHCHLGSQGEREGRLEGDGAEEPSSVDWKETALHTELKFTTSQILVEFQLSVAAVQPASGMASSRPGGETLSKLEEDPANHRVARTTKEGVLLSWQGLNATYPHGNNDTSSSSYVTGDFHVSGLQLMTIDGHRTAPVIRPAQLNCTLKYYQPRSQLDLPQVAVELSCGVLQLCVSRAGVDLIRQTARNFSDLLARGVAQGEPGGGEQETASEDPRGGSVGRRGTNDAREVVQFIDDLRRGDFKYTTDDSDPPATPAPGEIVFHLGGPKCEATMSWEYREPRAITSLNVLPVPFGVTTQEDAPVDIKVGCTLEYWDADCASFVALERFHVSESSTAEITVSCPTPSRRWKVTIKEVEWVDEEEGELFISKANVTDASGSLLPLSSILSPVSLAASLRVDSHFSPGFVPTCTLSAHCQEFQITLEHRASLKGHSFRGYSIAEDMRVPQELLRVSVNGLSCRSKWQRNSFTAAQVNGSVSADFVDFQDLTWRTALHPADLHADIKTTSVIGSFDPNSGIHDPKTRSDPTPLAVGVRCSPAVVRLSQGLLHTASLALHCWSHEEEGRRGSRCPVIPNHYVLCNNTTEELHIGQVSTDEDILLPSNNYIGYSWRSHKTVPQVLQVCFVTDGVWRWTKPFSIDTLGVQTVQLSVGKDTASLHVQVTSIGGLQKQITLFGSWQFSSTLPFDLDLQLVCTDEAEQNISAGAFSLTSGATLPSHLAADSQMAGVRLRASVGCGDIGGAGEEAGRWSKVYPLGSSSHKWSKPQLLAEMETKNGQMLHCWYNVKPIQSTSKGAWGNKISFAPLFAVCSHLPFDLNLDVSTIGSEEPLLSRHIPGKGRTTQLCDLSADVWYNLQYKQSDKTTASVPPLAVSTYLLLHLPFFSGLDNPTDSKWPYDKSKEISKAVADVSKPADVSKSTAATVITLPMEGGLSCSVLVAILRGGLNTIVVDLKPESLVVNRCPHTLTIVERLNSNERTVELGSGDVEVLVGKEFMLKTDRQGNHLSSEPITSPPLQKPEKGKSDEPLQVVLADDEDSNKKTLGELQVAYSKVDRMLIAAIRPSFIVQNNLSDPLDIWPCIITDSSPPEGPLSSCVQQIPAKEAKAIIFWQGHIGKGGAHAVMLRSSVEESTHQWSICLSANFIRHSFALPTGNSKEPFSACLLTTHDHEGVTYLVVSHDPSPKLQVQNLCSSTLDVMESGPKGIHISPQVLPPGCQVPYEPPALAKLYPIVYEEEIAGEREKEIWKAAKDVAIKFRARLMDSVKEEELHTWGEPFPLTCDTDRSVTIPGMGSVLVSTHARGNTLFVTLLPTRSISPLKPGAMSPLASPILERAVDFKCNLSQVVLCLDDETSNQSTITEILRIIADEIEAHYSVSAQEGIKIDFTLQALHIDNMTERSSGEYAVLLIPRAKHAARAKLIHSNPPPLLKFTVHCNPHTSNLIEKLYVSLQSVTVQVEDTLLHTLKSLLESYTLPGTLNTTQPSECRFEGLLMVPPVVHLEAERDASPIIISNLVIEPTAVHLNARYSLKVMLSCNDSPFSFSRYQLQNVHSNWSELSQTVAAHYFSAVIMHIGWLVGSLELIGSPGTLIQSIGRGIRDLISLPYEGIVRSPSLFILGIGRGTAACAQHFSSGAIQSVVNLTSSIARNMERLSMDPHHISYQDQKRRERPATHFTTGLATGASSFGLSLMSAVAGIVDQPMQSIHNMEESTSTFAATKSILGGIGKGLLGVIAKPVGGAMDFVSQTGQGIMHGTGLVHKLTHRAIGEPEGYTGPVQRSDLSTTVTKCVMKIGENSELLASIPVTHVTTAGSQRPSILLLTAEKLYLFDCESDRLQQSFPVEGCSITEKGSTHMIRLDEVELHLEPHTSETDSSLEETPEFKPVEYYLQLSPTQELVVLPQSATKETSESTTVEQEESKETSSLALRAKTHQAVQFLFVYHSVVQFILQPGCSFCVYSSVDCNL